jgi:hypothetical protein
MLRAHRARRHAPLRDWLGSKAIVAAERPSLTSKVASEHRASHDTTNHTLMYVGVRVWVIRRVLWCRGMYPLSKEVAGRRWTVCVEGLMGCAARGSIALDEDSARRRELKRSGGEARVSLRFYRLAPRRSWPAPENKGKAPHQAKPRRSRHSCLFAGSLARGKTDPCLVLWLLPYGPFDVVKLTYEGAPAFAVSLIRS